MSGVMVRDVFSALVLACLAAPFGFSAPPSAASYAATAMVLSVDPAVGRIVLSHDAIPGYMDAMVMSWTVPDREVLSGLHAGMKIGFRLEVTATASRLRDIRIMPYDSTERDPDQNRRLAVLEDVLGTKANAPPALVAGGKAPDFTLIDQDGRQVSLSQFAGKVVAITFIYTRCPLPDYCFRLSHNFGRIQRRFGQRLDRDLILLSITFDPVHDTPQVLEKYARTWQAGPGWRFLTGPLATVQHVCARFGMNFWPDEGLLTHSLRTVVIGRDQDIVASIEGNQFTATQLGDLIETALNHPAPKQ
jgi:protein SCO1/2